MFSFVTACNVNQEVMISLVRCKKAVVPGASRHEIFLSVPISNGRGQQNGMSSKKPLVPAFEELLSNVGNR